jgi:hypothetical protein
MIGQIFNIKQIWLVLFCLSVINIAVLPVWSQADTQTAVRGLTLTPAIIEQDVERGKSYKFEIKVENDENAEKLDIYTKLRTFEGGSEEGIPQIRDFKENEAHKNWVVPKIESFSLENTKSVTSEILVNIPLEANPGGYFYVVSYGVRQSNKNNTSQVIIQQEVSSLLFLNVVGQTKREVSIKSFGSENQIIDPFFDELNLNYNITTAGNSYYKPVGNIIFGEIKSPDQTIDINPNTRLILPNSNRIFSRALTSRFYIPWLNFWRNNQSNSNLESVNLPLLGNQNITLKSIYVDSNQEIQELRATKNVMFIPWKTALLLLSIAFVGYIIWLMSRKIKTFVKIGK